MKILNKLINKKMNIFKCKFYIDLIKNRVDKNNS